jgi:hypothetical protein
MKAKKLEEFLWQQELWQHQEQSMGHAKRIADIRIVLIPVELHKAFAQNAKRQ